MEGWCCCLGEFRSWHFVNNEVLPGGREVSLHISVFTSFVILPFSAEFQSRGSFGNLIQGLCCWQRLPEQLWGHPKQWDVNTRTDFGEDEGKPSSFLWQGNLAMRFYGPHTAPAPERRRGFWYFTHMPEFSWFKATPTQLYPAWVCIFCNGKHKTLPNFQTCFVQAKKLQQGAEINAQISSCDLLWAINVSLINLRVGKGDRNFPNRLASPFFLSPPQRNHSWLWYLVMWELRSAWPIVSSSTWVQLLFTRALNSQIMPWQRSRKYCSDRFPEANFIQIRAVLWVPDHTAVPGSQWSEKPSSYTQKCEQWAALKWIIWLHSEVAQHQIMPDPDLFVINLNPTPGLISRADCWGELWWARGRRNGMKDSIATH